MNREFEQDLTIRADTFLRTCDVAITYHTLSVTILPAHGQVEPEEIAVDHVDVASLGAAKGVNATIKRFIRANLNGYSGVFTIDRYCNYILRFFNGEISIMRTVVFVLLNYSFIDQLMGKDKCTYRRSRYQFYRNLCRFS